MKKLNTEYWKKLLETVAFSNGEISLYELVQKEHRHFHPSGSVQPSHEDLVVTEQLEKCGQLLGIPVRDHVIIGGTNKKMYSFAENRQLEGKKAPILHRKKS
ncbi:JAB domain-containing protein [Clostridium sp. C105KSO13]|uniref:JAB domain-containing protein n=1 Tax=Clostridium sp. C105KSO13 TaxID=1776045 RepID=UPI0007406A6C|nr:JAB domain-containing protein [Clostridium sp. C105KSO13]CUX28329.1 hypothetical protein BN3456_01073 [Clostridium sp. C105KSO13]